jgi:hypothetical protein
MILHLSWCMGPKMKQPFCPTSVVKKDAETHLIKDICSVPSWRFSPNSVLNMLNPGMALLIHTVCKNVVNVVCSCVGCTACHPGVHEDTCMVIDTMQAGLESHDILVYVAVTFHSKVECIVSAIKIQLCVCQMVTVCGKQATGTVVDSVAVLENQRPPAIHINVFFICSEGHKSKSQCTVILPYAVHVTGSSSFVVSHP